jgi:cytidine deaminase
MCAERGAVAAAVARGNRSFEAVVIATEAGEPTPPCGMCRQVLEEFSPQLLVVSVTRRGREARWTLDALLPMAFTPHSLDRR